MPIHKIKLLNKRDVANDTMVFEFEKPDGFTFVPGQYGGFTLINPAETDVGGVTRRFSILSTPDDNHIAIAMRIQSSAFKRLLKELPPGSEIKFAGPSGTFILHEDTNIPAIFIAGGIGITPFYSMIKHAIKHQPSRQIILFYGNQSSADAAFLQELSELQNSHANFKLIATMANPENSWQGEVGFITDDLIHKHTRDLPSPIFYICGSLAMVNALRATLKSLDINDDNIKVEDFPGY